MLPYYAGGAPRRPALDNLVRRNNQVHGEVVFSFRQWLINDLQRMHGGHDGCVRPYKTGFLK
ncbi:hypothetical protein FRACA_1920010 [Frankia canadensis]|uniref:Uncharacterized protein n=1 Tax=Frankia canadensis TaxID=1836972 RepID=A0A2I2KPC4_9ACTN|nr:hypothetical protein FRACA_1920010 [Frankia canadensis]SOU54804.1 hypothetical protein FRACA_1920010 [Frankia canadensis]